MTSEPQKTRDKSEILKDYNKFVNQINVIDLRVVAAKIDNLGCEKFPEANSIKYTVKSWYENKEKQFCAYQKYDLSIIDTTMKKKAARLSVTFTVTYSSEIPITDEFMGFFTETSLQLNTWPYFREFAHNSFARMGWSNVVAPSYKTMSNGKRR